MHSQPLIRVRLQHAIQKVAAAEGHPGGALEVSLGYAWEHGLELVLLRQGVLPRLLEGEAACQWGVKLSGEVEKVGEGGERKWWRWGPRGRGHEFFDIAEAGMNLCRAY